MTAPSRRASLAAATGIVLMLSACGGSDDQQAGRTAPTEDTAEGASDCSAVETSASHHLTAGSAVHVGLQRLAEQTSEQTDGRVTIEVFSDAQLGGLAEMTSNLQSGGVGIALIDGGTLSQFDGELGLLDLPYLFEDAEQFNEVMDGPFGEDYNARVEDVGVTPLFWSAVGARDMFLVEQEVRTPDDLASLRMRVPGAPVWIATFEAFGASPTAIPAGDLYTSLDTGVVDGFELPLGTVIDLNLNEPVSIWAPTGHMMNSILIAAAPSFMDQLCEEDRAAFMEAVESAEELTRSEWASVNEEAATVLEEELTVMEDLDIGAFEEATEVVHTDFVAENGAELYESLTATLSE